MHPRAQVQVVFEEWVACRGPWSQTRPFDEVLEAHVPPEALLMRLQGCADVMSPAVCDVLGVPWDATYAEGVEALRASGAPGLGAPPAAGEA